MNSEEIEDDIVAKLNECVDILLECEEQKNCKKCKYKSGCWKFVRSVLGVLCRIQSVQLSVPENQFTVEHMFT